MSSSAEKSYFLNFSAIFCSPAWSAVSLLYAQATIIEDQHRSMTRTEQSTDNRQCKCALINCPHRKNDIP